MCYNEVVHHRKGMLSMFKKMAGLSNKTGIKSGEYDVSHEVYVEPAWHINWSKMKIGKQNEDAGSSTGNGDSKRFGFF